MAHQPNKTRLDGKVAVVTGSSSGIGKAIALRFAGEGASVVLAARRKALLDQTLAQIRKDGGEGIVVQTDVTDDRQVKRLIADTVKKFGRIDIFVNNAGIVGGGRIADVETDSFDKIIDTNLRGTFLCAKAAFNQMVKNDGGIIINMSSVAGLQAWEGTGIYSASKFGVMGLTKALADEGRPHKIKVCAICPGGVAAELVDASPAEIERSQKINPFDIAETAVYLCTLGPHAIVHQIVVDRMGADW